MPISTSRATTCSICASVARSSITTTMAVCRLHCRCPIMFVAFAAVSPWTTRRSRPPRLVDDAFEQPRDRVRRRAALPRRCRARARAPASRAPADRPRRPAPSSAGRSRTRTRARSLSRRTSTSSTRSMSLRKSSSVGIERCVRQPTHVALRRARSDPRDRARFGDHRHQRAADHGRVGVARRLRRRAPAARCRTRARSASTCARGCGAPALRRRRDAIARAGHAQPRDPVQKPAAQLRRLLNPRVGRRRAQQEDRIDARRPPASRGTRRPLRSADRAPARRRRRPRPPAARTRSMPMRRIGFA